jgi:hypothetical protein
MRMRRAGGVTEVIEESFLSDSQRTDVYRG